MLRVHRIPFSTNVERVALAAGHKRLEVEWIDHDPADRSEIEALSGQPLVPVAELDGEVLVDSTRIVERLEALRPDPPPYPAEPHARAEVELFVEWFNEVWKGPPNAIAAGDDDPALRRRLAGWQRTFERLLDGRDYLLGHFGAADVCAFPFIKYAIGEPDPADTDPFHAVLRELDAPPSVRAWIARVDAHPRA
jgi:glutathione S-transferase